MLNLFFPIRCIGCQKSGQYICSSCQKLLEPRQLICSVCTKPAMSGITHPRCSHRHQLDGLINIFRYNSLMQQIVKKFKFRLVTDLASELSSLVCHQLTQQPIVTNLWHHHQFIITPLPLHPKRERWRGFNQSSVIGKLLAKNLHLNFQEHLIKRIRDTASQSETKIFLTPEEAKNLSHLDPFAQAQKRQSLLKQKRLKIRRKNIAKAFQVTQPLTHQNLIIVDDVWTTGATMSECAKVLKKSGANQVWGLTLSR